MNYPVNKPIILFFVCGIFFAASDVFAGKVNTQNIHRYPVPPAPTEMLKGENLNKNIDEFSTQIDNNDSRITGLENASSIGKLSCAANQIAKFDGANWVCEPLTTYSAGNGISISNNVISNTQSDTLAGLTCAANQIARRTATGWVCSDETVRAAGAGIGISNGTITNTQPGTLSGLSCTTSQIARYNGSAWVCSDETVRSAGTGISISNGTITNTLPDTDTLSGLSCSTGQVAKFNGTQWQCMADENTGSSGVAYAADELATITLTSTITEFTPVTVTLTPPGPGYIIVSFSADYKISHALNAIDELQVAITDGTANVFTGLASRRYTSIDATIPTALFYGSVSTQAIYPVTTTASKKFRILVQSNKLTTAANSSLFRPVVSAIFVPNAY